MSRTVYVNGDYLPETEARVSIFDRGFLMADGVYEVTSVLDGKLIDFRGQREIETKQALEELLEWTAPAREGLKIDVNLPERNGTQRAREKFRAGESIETIYRESVEETARTFGAIS